MSVSRAVLVHGAWGSPAMWDPVTEELTDRGIEVDCADLPTCREATATLADDVGHVRELVGERPCVLVGHSYGGVVIGQAAVDLPAVDHLVFVAAMMTDEGENLFEVSLQRPAGGPPPDISDDGTSLPAQWGNPDLYSPEAMARFEALPPRRFAVAAAVTPSGPVAWRTTPSTVVVATRDNILHPDTQRELAGRREGPTIELDSAHVIQYELPRPLAEIIATAG